MTGRSRIRTDLALEATERFQEENVEVHGVEIREKYDEEKDVPKLYLMLDTKPEFPGRPGVGSIYSVSWVFKQGKGYLGYLLARDLGAVNAEDIDALVDKLVERTDGIAAKYGSLWK